MARLEYYTSLKKGFILQFEGVHFEIFAAALRAATFFFLAALRAVKHGFYTLNLLPTPMCLQLLTPEQRLLD